MTEVIGAGVQMHNNSRHSEPYALAGDAALKTDPAPVHDNQRHSVAYAAVNGQLGGDPATPDVRGLRETGGPTLLTLAAVANGGLLKRSGLSIVGVPDRTPAYALVSGSNAITTGQTLVDITGLSLPLLANSTYEFEAVLTCLASTTAGNKYGVNFSASGATVTAGIMGQNGLNASYDIIGERISAFNTPTGNAFWYSNVFNFPVLIKGVVTTGANTGNLTIQHLKVTSGTSTVFINSFLKVTWIA